MRYSLLWCALAATLSAAAGCNSNSLGGSSVDDGGTGGDGGGGVTKVLDVQPGVGQTLNITLGQMSPTVTYSATLDGQPAAANWSVDRPDVGTIAAGPSIDATFVPTGTTAGLVTVTVKAGGQTVKRQIVVALSASQNGANTNIPSEKQQVPTTAGELTAGGGVGGVGGEGLGPAVTDQATLTALDNPTNNGATQNLAVLYPYDKTVWPRGLLAPLLMWNWTPGDADAIKIEIKSTGGSFTYKGTFGRPAVLGTTGRKFIRHPIPQDIWDLASNSAGGANDKLVVSITLAKGGVGYGPISQTWTIAAARPAGIIYYNSYGTQLRQNSGEASFNGGPEFGAAVLSIKAGDTKPSVVAGTTTPGSNSGCRVCHVVAASGNKLIVQQGNNYARTSAYDLKNNNAETVLTGYDGTYGWASLNSDASLAFTNKADLAANAPQSRLYNFPPTSTTAITVNGIPTDLQAGSPSFSPDNQHMAFEFMGGTIGTATGNGTQLVSLDYASATKTFSNLRVLATMTGGMRAGFPSFLPTNNELVFHYQTVNSNHRYNTWHGAQAQIWRSDLATGKAVVLSALNGLGPDGKTSYLPTIGTNHGSDTTLNYEPVVAPIAAGGYAWVIFTSRRLYGNLATTDPWQSDPRNYDAGQYNNVTCKKLWVAALDLNAPAGTDSSHPAFYLPAQELVAGNARGFWVLDPCRPDGATCQTGDQCCNGFCNPNGSGDTATNICASGSTNQCSGLQERCSTKADCCDPTNQCINNFCASVIG